MFNKKLIQRLVKSNINTDMLQRWEEGHPHHPKAIKLADEIANVDMLLLGDSFDFEFGGDGDNGENLLYILDVLFELEDAENNER